MNKISPLGKEKSPILWHSLLLFDSSVWPILRASVNCQKKKLFAHFWFKINHCMMPFWAFFHSNSTCCLLYFRGIVVPNHDSPMGSYGNNVVSIGRVTSFGNWATFSFALGDQRTLLVSPDLEKKIRKNNLQTS